MKIGGLAKIIKKFNFPNVENDLTNYKNLVQAFDSKLLQKRIHYLDLVRVDYLGNGKLYQKLLNIDESIANKIATAGKPGSHGEVLLMDEIMKELKTLGLPTTDAELARIRIFVKNKNGGNMCRCPNCF